MEFVFIMALAIFFTGGMIYIVKKSDADYAKKHQKTA